MPNKTIKNLCTLLLGILSLSFIACSSDSTSLDGLYIQSIDIIADNNVVPVGVEQQYTATALFNDGTFSDVTNSVSWRSSNAAVADIDATGLVTGIAAGDVTITASVEFNSQYTQSEAALKIELIALKMITLTTFSAGDLLYTNVNETEQVIAKGLFTDGSTTKGNINALVTWDSFDTDVAIVNDEGLVTGIRKGSTYIRAKHITVEGKEISNVISAVVDVALPSKIYITGGNTALIDTDISLSALGYYTDGNHLNLSEKAIWSSSNDSIAVVDMKGKVRALSLGEVEITAKFKDATAKHALSVNNRGVQKLEIQDGYNNLGNAIVINNLEIALKNVKHVSYSPVSKNAYYPVVWAVFADGSKEYVNASAFWSSSNPVAVFIDYTKDSLVFGRSLLDQSTPATITAYYAGKSVSFKAYVESDEPPRTLDKVIIKIDDSAQIDQDIDFTVGDESWLTAYGEYSNGDVENINRKVVYTSSDNTKAFVLGFGDTNLRAESPGQATITATFEDKRETETGTEVVVVTATITVNVADAL